MSYFIGAIATLFLVGMCSFTWFVAQKNCVKVAQGVYTIHYKDTLWTLRPTNVSEQQDTNKLKTKGR